jgi:hypothetical protein
MSHAIQHFFKIKLALTMIESMHKPSLGPSISIEFLAIQHQRRRRYCVKGGRLRDVSSHQNNALGIQKLGVMREHKMRLGCRSVPAAYIWMLVVERVGWLAYQTALRLNGCMMDAPQAFAAPYIHTSTIKTFARI